ncbi:MAG: hypothetical protein EOL88_08010, partial [Bacteroidia bacterium]|nr:hypothetical protein [Bacteroidia bacterium]
MKTLQTQLLMLLALLFTLSLSAQTTFNVPSTEYPTIQAAIDAAADGDVINIAAGTYDEALNITKRLTLQGEDPTTTILKNSTVNAHTLSVANTADNVTIKNCGFDANGRFITNGINAINFSSGGCDQFMIDNCTFTNGYYCVVNGYVNSLTMQNSTIDNCKSGVNVQKGDNLNITNTTISVIAQGEDNDTYCVRFGNSTPSSTTMNINGCTLTVDKNNFTATEGTYHAAVVIRTGAAGNLSLNQNSLAGEVVNLCTTQLNATCNWWGTTAASTIATLVTGSIDVSTVLDAENGTCVAPTTNLVTNATNNTTYTTIQAAITDADDGDVIEVSIGTFTEILNLQNKQLTINGAGSTQTIIDATGTTTYAIQNFGNNVTISNIKLINSGNYGFKASGCSNLTLTNILAEDNAKTAIDILGVQGATLTNIEVHNTAGGFGLSIGDSEDITVENITTSGNNWAGVTIQSKGAWYPVVCDNIVFTGTFNATDDVELLIEKDPYNEVYSPITNLTLPAQYEYVTYGLRKPGDEDYMQWYYQKTLADAESFAQVIAASTFINVYVANDEEDNFYVAPGLTIQAAVDAATAGDVVNVDAGTYIEQVHITTNDISLIGSSTDDVIIKSPEELSEFYSTSNNNYPVVFIDGVTTTTIKNLTVDGDHQGNSNYRFQGIGIWNSGVVLKDLKVINVMDNPFSGAQHGVGVYSYNNTGGPYTINIDNVDVTDFQKNAFAICGEGVTSSITNCDVVGAGPTDVTAQNGIQVYGKNSVSTITDCTISDIEWTGETWTASAFLSHYADCEISNVDITNGQTNFYTYGSSITLNNSSITNPSGDAFYGYALSPESTKNQIIPEASPYFDESFMGDQKSTSNINVTISNLDITGLDFENSWGIGILADPNSQATASITNCNISHFDYAIVAYDYSSDETGIVNISAHENNLSDNTFGFGSNSTILQNANRNYWGDPTGPYHLDLNPNGLGAEVEDNISFFPYYTDAAMTTLCEMPPVYNSSQETYATTIQGAIDAANDYDVIMVAPGTYTERVVIDKPLSLYGATYDVSKYGYTIPANYQWDDNSESVINYPGNLPEDIFQAVDILSSDVTFKGFIVQILNAKKDFDNNLLRINGTIDRPDDDHMTLDNITIENNILGPVTNTASQDGTYGRMNLYLATPCYPADYQGLTNSTIADNKIIDALGNGNNIFIWGAAEA